MSIVIVVNGEPHTAPEGQTVFGLLSQLNIDPSRVAVELDRRIVRKQNWQDTTLQPGARIEIIQFVGGG